MKAHGLKWMAMALLMLAGRTSYAQAVQPEVPGDNFSLEGALDLFKRSTSPEEFERMLNSPDSKVNNLDLNGDGYIDYIRVFDRHSGAVHAFILQAVISERESQDIAVIELEKLHDGKAVLQIIGDEDIFGVTTIIEPTQEVRTYAGTTAVRNVVNVWAWPSVQFVYSPYYAGWYSPWGWHSRPRWWRTWRPVAYVHYYPIWRPYYAYYSVCPTRRIAYAYDIYRPYRSTSVVVYNRYHTQVVQYRSTYSDSYRNGRDRNDDRRTVSQGGARMERSSLQGRDRTYVSPGNNNPARVNTVQPQRRATVMNSRELPSGREVVTPAAHGANYRNTVPERRAPERVERSSSQGGDNRSPRTTGIPTEKPVYNQTGQTRQFARPTQEQRRPEAVPQTYRNNTSGGYRNVPAAPVERNGGSIQRTPQNNMGGSVQQRRAPQQPAARPAPADKGRSVGNVPQRAAVKSAPSHSARPTRGRD